MANIKQVFGGVFDLADSVIGSAKPIAKAVEYSSAAVAEASVQLLVAVAASEEEHARAAEIVARYK